MVRHVMAGPLQHRKRRVPFVQVAHLRTEGDRVEHAPPPDPKDDLLLEPQFGVAAVQIRTHGDRLPRRGAGVVSLLSSTSAVPSWVTFAVVGV